MVSHAVIRRRHGVLRGMSHPSDRGSGAAADRRRVLIVDDEPASRELLDIILTEEGHETDCVSGGEEALERLAARSYDVVVSDLQMPGMDGLALTQEIRSRFRDTEVL